MYHFWNQFAWHLPYRALSKLRTVIMFSRIFVLIKNFAKLKGYAAPLVQ